MGKSVRRSITSRLWRIRQRTRVNHWDEKFRLTAANWRAYSSGRELMVVPVVLPALDEAKRDDQGQVVAFSSRYSSLAQLNEAH